MISAIEGRPGMGKSVYLVGKALSYLASGYVVYSNISIKVDKKYQHRFFYYESFEELTPVKLVDVLKRDKKVRGIKIIMDEMQVYLSSRNWDKLDIKFQLLLQQHRKRGIDIFGATQSIKRADVVFRELIQKFYRVKKITSFKFMGYGMGFFYLREYDPDTIESPGRDYDAIGWPMLYYADPIVMRIYDTSQEYELHDPEGRIETRIYVHQKKEVVSPVLVSSKFEAPAEPAHN